MKKDFEIVIVPNINGEDCVQARLTQWPEKLYKEDELMALSTMPCLPDSLKDQADYARLAVIRQKSDMGFFRRRFTASAADQTGRLPSGTLSSESTDVPPIAAEDKHSVDYYIEQAEIYASDEEGPGHSTSRFHDTDNNYDL